MPEFHICKITCFIMYGVPLEIKVRYDVEVSMLPCGGKDAHG